MSNIKKINKVNVNVNLTFQEIIDIVYCLQLECLEERKLMNKNGWGQEEIIQRYQALKDKLMDKLPEYIELS